MTDTVNVQLLPCPFCGGEASIERYGNTRVSTQYHCDDCGCFLETGEEFNHGRSWNTRATLASAPKAEPVDPEWFGVSGAVNETEALAVALFAVRCPGILMTDEDMHYYLAAAESALSAVSAELDQPEAPKVEQEPVANPLVFGLGALVVDHGKYGGEPAVFVAKAKAAGRVGELTGRDYFDRESLQPGELVLQFPTDTQAKSVADALVGSPAPASDELLEALKPFADAAEDLDDGEAGHIWERPAAMSIDASDLRRASELYAKHKGPQ